MCFDQIEIMRGDAYIYGFRIKDESGNLVTDEDVLDVEISLASILKTYAKGEVTYEGEGVWGYPISQKESFSYPAKVRAQVRVKFKSDDNNDLVIGRKVLDIPVVSSDSKEEL